MQLFLSGRQNKSWDEKGPNTQEMTGKSVSYLAVNLLHKCSKDKQSKLAKNICPALAVTRFDDKTRAKKVRAQVKR